jgi:cytochrome c oxidase assembly protein subunit 11
MTARRLSNGALGLICIGVFAGMVGMAFASVPLYRAFCQATGFDGAVRRATAASGSVSTRTVTVRFDTNVRGLSWRFEPVQPSQTVKLGENKLAFFRATNTGDRPVTGRAIYNVAPQSAGAYFSKLECFCFKNQTIAPGQTVEFPVVYFVDPRYGTDSDTAGAPEITLSYTFFPAVTGPRVASGDTGTASSSVSPLGGSRRAGL